MAATKDSNGTSIFDKLVLDLSSTERNEMLDKIRSLEIVSEEPLHEKIEEAGGEINFEKEYLNLSFFRKLIILIIALFSGKSRDALVEHHLLARLAAKINAGYPRLISVPKKQLLPNMMAELDSLYQLVLPLKNSLEAALGTEKGDFYAFLVSMELELVQQRIIDETDPVGIYDSGKFSELNEVRSEMDNRFNKILEDMNREDRQKMHQFVFALTRFYQLSIFDFDELIALFRRNQFGGRGALSFGAAKSKLMRLCDLVQSALYPPPSNALKAVFLYSNYEKISDPNVNLNFKIEQFLEESEIAFSAIRRFNKKVPLRDILKCILQNYNYKSETLKGGEDWFVLFRNFWEKQFDRIFKGFYKEKKLEVFTSQALQFLGLDFFRKLEYYSADISEDHYTIRYFLSILFIKNFYEKIFLPRMNKALNVLFINGNFYKKENRTSFTDSYNGISTVYDRINELDNALGPEGELGAEMESSMNEMVKAGGPKKKKSQVFKEINTRAKHIVDEALSHYTMLNNILGGILHGQVGGKYDTISNMKSIGGRENHETISSWQNSLNKLNKALDLLREIYSLEEKA